MLNFYRTGSVCTSGHASVLDAHGEESDSLPVDKLYASPQVRASSTLDGHNGTKANWLSDTTRDRRRLRIGPTYRAPLRYDPTIFSTSPRGLLSGPPAFPFYHRGIVLDLPLRPASCFDEDTTHHLLYWSNNAEATSLWNWHFVSRDLPATSGLEMDFNARRKPAPPDSDKDGLAGAPFENGGLTQFRGTKSRARIKMDSLGRKLL
ncbi:uncharacterized protein CLUP02_18094 [Colletotrichum lupini]|uniref:Uncharacterized protein n=1 Tax=Colletotrichum lupini TaxID=145971 RepID=A0A9Q8WAZ9_9PEZI|nr:uncharacterized protein CLUP02_18094 [Colletotrichum lupini]UQC76581.1 hypothetical protein CLUP02_18094 [Colletotrichum lupini]